MKNLSPIPRLSIIADFAILITVAVCLTGFVAAEVKSNHKQSEWDPSISEGLLSKRSISSRSISNPQPQNSNARDDELTKSNYMKNAESDSSQKFNKRNSEGLGKEAETLEDDSEADGYGYDDDEYYHLDFKRNEDQVGRTDNKAVEAMQEDPNKKEGYQNQKYGTVMGQKTMDDNNKETQTVEMLSFKESHPNPATEDTINKGGLSKPMTSQSAHKKIPNQPVSSLNMNDLKENSGIIEKMKDRKDEASRLSPGSSMGDQKLEGKKSAKVTEEKDAMKLKESKYSENLEKKEKEVSVKEGKESGASKSLKDDKDKIDSDLKSSVKVSDSGKLDEKIEKINTESKDGFSTKLVKGNRENAKLNGKLNSDAVSSNDISQISNRASFVTHDYRDSSNALKTQAIDEDEKDSEEMNEKNVGLSDYDDELTREKDSLKEENTVNNYDYRGNNANNLADSQNNKEKEYITIPIAFEMKDENLNEYYKRQNAWKKYAGSQDMQQPAQMAYDHSKGEPIHLTLPQSEFESTDYHKNYLKSLKKYKGMEDHSKIIPQDKYSQDLSNTKMNTKLKNAKKRKRSQVNKRKTFTFENVGGLQRMNANQLKNIYSQLNAMQMLQQQQHQQPQQQQQPQYPSHFPSLFDSKTLDSWNFLFNGYQNTGREVRKSPGKLEYEIKIINQNQPNADRDTPLLRISQNRKKKNIGSKSNDRYAERFLKHYPYSQVSRDDLTRFGSVTNELNGNERKFKRKAPAWQDRDSLEFGRQIDESVSKNKGAPSGYYSNRVKFGQKHYVPKDAVTSESTDAVATSRMSPFSSKKIPAEMEKNFLQRSWRDSKIQEGKHDPIKRFDQNVFSKTHQNSLLLVKKDRNGDRVTKTFMDGNSKVKGDADINSDQLAQILSKNNDYIVLKKTDTNKFQKVEEGQVRSAGDVGSALNKKYDIFGLSQPQAVRDSSKHNRALFIRSYRSNDQKLHNQSTKSNLKKTFEKFKDFADFFKDSEQEPSAQDQQPTQENKERSEIVFSEDKIPDPIVISNDVDATSNMKPKTNTLPSISNNFKQSDQEKKTTDVMKFDDPSSGYFVSKEVSEKSNWEPALKNIFPEAKSINSVQKNGNEIIVLDFDRNHLKTDQGNKVVLSKTLKEQPPPYGNGNEQLYLPFGSVQKTPNNPLTVAGNRQVEVVLHDNNAQNFLDSVPNVSKDSSKNMDSQNQMLNRQFTNNALGSSPLSSNTLATNQLTSSQFMTNPLISNPLMSNPLTENQITANQLMSNPLASSSLGSNPLGSNPLGSNPLGSNPLGSNPLGSSPLATSPFSSSSFSSSSLSNNPLSSNPLSTNSLMSNPLMNNQVSSNPLMNNPLTNSQLPGTTLTSRQLANNLLMNNPLMANQMMGPPPNMFNNPSKQPVISVPLSQFVQLPYLLRQAAGKKFNNIDNNGFKTVSKKSLSVPDSNAKMSENVNQFLRDFHELSELNKETTLLKKTKLNKKRANSNASSTGSSSQVSSYNEPDTKQKENNAVSDSKTVSKVDGNSQLEKQSKWQSKAAESNSAPQGQWVSASSPQRQFSSSHSNGDEYYPKEMSENLESFLANDEIREGNKENNYQNELLEELSAASNKVQRLRREGVAEQKLRKIMEDALPFRGRRWSSDDLTLTGKDNKPKSSANSYSDTRTHESEKKLKRGIKSTETPSKSNQGIDDSSADRNQQSNLISSRESAAMSWRNRRRKRSPANDSEIKVSNPANKILKNLEEDTDQSVYSLGITRRLLSIDEEEDMEEADDPKISNLIEDKSFEIIEQQSQQPNEHQTGEFVNNMNNKCIDPVILDLFRGDEDSDQYIRKKRNVFTNSHSNYKREIDLDESMPNDFQNFLVTSLGLDSHVTAYGSQKRDTNKWETKENSAPGFAESPLEKREVPNHGSVKRQEYKSNDEEFETERLHANTVDSADEGGMLDEVPNKPKAKATAEYDESKVPTQIRIQITKASSKEKKSSKPLIDENSMAPTEMEMDPKEKDYFEKSRFTPIHMPNSQKLFPMPKLKYPIDFGDMEPSEDESQQMYYVMSRPFRRLRRKKKKYISENPMKPIKDFIAFDQKAMETLMRRYFADQTLPRTLVPGQKLPTPNHLPQVETVYNPTQETNKAQVEAYKPLLKINSLNTKNSVSAKNNLQPKEPGSLEDGLMRSYLKDKPLHPKNDELAAKEMEDVDWKPYSRMRENSAANPSGQPEMLNYKPYTPANQQNKNDLSLTKKPNSQMRWNYQMPSPVNNPPPNIFNSNPAGPIKIKPGGQIWSSSNKDPSNAVKGWRKLPNYLMGSPYAKENKEKNLNGGTSPVDETWNMFNHYLNKKQISNKYKTRDALGPLRDDFDPAFDMRYRPYKFYQSLEDEKSSVLEPLPPQVLDKDIDYSDNLDDDYLDGDEIKLESTLELDSPKKEEKLAYEPDKLPNIHSDKNIDVDDMINDDEEEADEDYDENTEDNLDEYSLLSPPNSLQSDISKNDLEDTEKLKDVYGPYIDDSMYSPNNIITSKAPELELQDTKFEQPEFKNPKLSESLEPESNQITLEEGKNEIDPFGSSGILKKLNEKSNVLGQNLIKSLNRYNYDDGAKETEKLMASRAVMRDYRNPETRSSDKFGKKKLDWQGKLKRSQGMWPIGSRLFYASKMEVQDAKDPTFQEIHFSQRRNNRNVYNHSPKRNPRNAELQGSESECEYESENNHRCFTGNLLGSENGDAVSRDASNHEHEESGKNSQSIEDKSEDNSETISEDNVLENVIGKYIMRKSIKVKPEENLKKNTEDKETSDNEEVQKKQDESTNHQRRKKSLSYSENSFNEKSWRKRLAPEYSTGNRYKKFNENNKLKRPNEDGFGDYNFDMLNSVYPSQEENLFSVVKNERQNEDHWENQVNIKGKKRSALSIFKKFGAKDKKAGSGDGSAIGFEPILSTADSKFESLRNTKSEALDRNENSGAATKNENKRVSQLSTAKGSFVLEKQKEKCQIDAGKLEGIISKSQKLEGPWKIDLNEKYEESNQNDNSSTDAAAIRSNEKVNLVSSEPSQDVKAYLVIRKNVDPNLNSGAAKIYTPPSGTSKREVFLLFSVNSRKPRRSPDINVKFSTKRRHKRKSVFPLPQNDASTIGDNRHVDEETSTYLGEQIVDAILSKVSNNPRFKKTIEPGLVGKMSKRRDEPQDINREQDYPEEVQSLLQKVVFDIEKIAERHVKKRMCNKIDKKSQEFLHSLLDVPDDNCQEEELNDEAVMTALRRSNTSPDAMQTATFNENQSPAISGVAPSSAASAAPSSVRSAMLKAPTSPAGLAKLNTSMTSAAPSAALVSASPTSVVPTALVVPAIPVSSTSLSAPTVSAAPAVPLNPALNSVSTSTPLVSSSLPLNVGNTAAHFSNKMCDTLKKKQNTLKKLIDDYYRLSELEKQTISVSYQYLRNELEQTNRLLNSLTSKDDPFQRQNAKLEANQNTITIDPQPPPLGFPFGVTNNLPNNNMPNSNLPLNNLPINNILNSNMPISNLPINNMPTSNLPNTNIPNPNLPISNIPNSNFPNCNLPVSSLPYNNIPNSNIPSTNLPNINVPNINLPNSNMPNTNLPNSNIPSTNIPSTNIPSTNIPSSNIPNTNIPNTNIPNTNIPNTNFPNTNFPNTNLPNTNLPNTNFPHTNFPIANLSNRVSDHQACELTNATVNSSTKAHPNRLVFHFEPTENENNYEANEPGTTEASTTLATPQMPSLQDLKDQGFESVTDKKDNSETIKGSPKASPLKEKSKLIGYSSPVFIKTKPMNRDKTGKISKDDLSVAVKGVVDFREVKARALLHDQKTPKAAVKQPNRFNGENSGSKSTERVSISRETVSAASDGFDLFKKEQFKDPAYDKFPIDLEKILLSNKKGFHSTSGKPSYHSSIYGTNQKCRVKRHHHLVDMGVRKKPADDKAYNDWAVENDSDFEENPRLEYLIWTSMPLVRRRLNNLALGEDVQKVPFRGTGRRK